VQRVVMEATSDYWKPVFYLLEAHGLEPWLVNARDVKHLPGRPKTDVIDASGCASWPSARCCAPVSCRHSRSGGCGI
jgi:transposase